MEAGGEDQTAPGRGGDASRQGKEGLMDRDAVDQAQDGGGDESGSDEDDLGQARKRYRKYAVWCSYVGAGYHGMQRNPGCPSIEEELEKALVAVGAIRAEHAGSFTAIKWSRAARTDKGVSAISQVVSAKLALEPRDSFVERVNAHLPAQIRVLGATRVTEGFAARQFCDRRRYEYLLPVWMFDRAVGARRSATDRAAGEKLQQEWLGAAGEEAAAPGAAVEGVGPQDGGAEGGKRARSGEGAGTSGAHQDGSAGEAREHCGGQQSHARKQEWRLRRMHDDAAASTYVLTDAERVRLNNLLQCYVGTHNFHNYTVRVDAHSGEAQRYILSYECPGTVVLRGVHWARLVVVGQSFMLHQIRKMVGMVVAIMRGAAPESCLKAALDPDRDFNVPMAPELGLFLAETYFDSYNKRFGSTHARASLEEFQEAADAFQRDKVYESMAARDAEECVNGMWLRSLHTDPSYRFWTWEHAPKVRHVSGKRARRGSGNPNAINGLETYGLYRTPHTPAAVQAAEDRDAKRAAAVVPAAALAAAKALEETKQREVSLAAADELDALY